MKFTTDKIMEIDFANFVEIENSLRKNYPPLLYKYRDWSCEFHKKIITENEIWFAHPKTLNDDFDIRLPYKFNYEEIYTPQFFKKRKNIPYTDANKYWHKIRKGRYVEFNLVHNSGTLFGLKQMEEQKVF